MFVGHPHPVTHHVRPTPQSRHPANRPTHSLPPLRAKLNHVKWTRQPREPPSSRSTTCPNARSPAIVTAPARSICSPFSSPPTASLTKFFDAISITSQTQEAVSLIDWKPLTAIALPFLLQHRSHSAKDRSLSVVGTVSFRARFAMGIELADIQRCGVSINV